MSVQYEKYKESHIKHHGKEFLKEHENDNWFKEKYDPIT